MHKSIQTKPAGEQPDISLRTLAAEVREIAQALRKAARQLEAIVAEIPSEGITPRLAEAIQKARGLIEDLRARLKSARRRLGKLAKRNRPRPPRADLLPDVAYAMRRAGTYAGVRAHLAGVFRERRQTGRHRSRSAGRLIVAATRAQEVAP